MVDLLPAIDGVDFDRAWKNRVEAIIDLESGLKANFISGPDLVAAKLAAGRPQPRFAKRLKVSRPTNNWLCTSFSVATS
jgi:hypothetical protein